MEPPLNRQAEIQHALRSFYQPIHEATFRRVAEDWTRSELLYALDRLGVENILISCLPHMQTLLRGLLEERSRLEFLAKHSAQVAAERTGQGQRDPKTVFVVHGHDVANLEVLCRLLESRYKLAPIVLSLEPGQGRTIIEKFEQEAQRASFAFVLLTPDDEIRQKNGTEYFQARPNVLFELGWFYGRLGRKNVCILLREGAKLHSDLEGISQIRFQASLDEKVDQIDRELRAAEMPMPDSAR